MAGITIVIGPQDHGKTMSLDDFGRAETQDGFLYELSRGIITASDVPNLRHMAQVDTLRQLLSEHRTKHPQQIYRIAAGNECKILITRLNSERHPDLAVYRLAPIDLDDLWATWVPDLVVEVVSPGAEERDYVQKREEYLLFGISEYWIVDAERREVLVLRRRGGQWKERLLRPTDTYRTPLLPGFELPVALIFQAVDAVPPG